MRSHLRIACLIATFAATGCGKSPSASTPDASRERAVYTTFYPTTYFAERIAQGVVPVVCPLPDTADPIFWQPSPAIIGAYQRASLIVINGASFEKWVPMASLPDSRVLDTAGELGAEELIDFDTVSHSHGLAGDHTHDGIDGHVWLDPEIARRQAAAIAEGMIRVFPEHAETFRAGRAALDADLIALDDALTALAPRVQRAVILCSHPAYNYLDRRFTWGATSLDLDPAAPLTDDAWTGIAQTLARGERQGPAIMLWESAPLEETTRQLRERHGIESVVFSPCETPPREGDYLSAMRASVNRLKAAVASSD